MVIAGLRYIFRARVRVVQVELLPIFRGRGRQELMELFLWDQLRALVEACSKAWQSSWKRGDHGRFVASVFGAIVDVVYLRSGRIGNERRGYRFAHLESLDAARGESGTSEDVLTSIERRMLEAFAECGYGQRLSSLAIGFMLCRKHDDTVEDADKHDPIELREAMRRLLELRLLKRVTPGALVMTDAGWVMVHGSKWSVPIRQLETSRGIEYAVLDVLVRPGSLSHAGIGGQLCHFDARRVRQAIDRLELDGRVISKRDAVVITTAGREMHDHQTADLAAHIAASSRLIAAVS